MAHLVDPEKKMAAVLFGMASAMPWMLQSFDDDSRYATFESGGSSAVGFARLGGHHVPTSHRHRRLTRAEMGRFASPKQRRIARWGQRPGR
jgi:hypothetical protein